MWSSLPPAPPDRELSLEDYADLCPSNGAADKDRCVPRRRELSRNPAPVTGESAFDPMDTKPSSSSSASEMSLDKCTDQQPSLSRSGELAENPNRHELPADADVNVIDYGIRGADVGFHGSDAFRGSAPSDADDVDDDVRKTTRLPPPEEFGHGNPFLLFVCLAVLLEERDAIMKERKEYDDLVMHFDRMVRKHCPERVLSKAMRLFAEYLRTSNTLTL